MMSDGVGSTSRQKTILPVGKNSDLLRAQSHKRIDSVKNAHDRTRAHDAN
jgi:hypothetical protein